MVKCMKLTFGFLDKQLDFSKSLSSRFLGRLFCKVDFNLCFVADHNKIHAADVLHGCWFLTTQEVPGFGYHYPHCSSDPSGKLNVESDSTLQPSVLNLSLFASYFLIFSLFEQEIMINDLKQTFARDF